MPTATDANGTTGSPDQSMSGIDDSNTYLQDLKRDAAIINDYGEAFNQVDFSSDAAVEALAYSSRRVWGDFSTYTEQESFVWLLLHLLQSNPTALDICNFFWRQLHTSQITTVQGDSAFWALATGLQADATRFCQNLDRWDLKSLIESDDDIKVRNHCKNILASNVTLPAWETGIYALLCGELEHALGMCSTWEERVAVGLSVGLKQGLGTREEIGQVLANASSLSSVGENPYYSLVTAIVLNKVPEYLEENVPRVLNSGAQTAYPQSETAQSPNLQFLTNVRLDAHLSIVCGVTPLTEQIIQAYIELLLISNNTKLIPEYVRFLDASIQPTVYGAVLGRINQTQEEQGIQLAFAQRYHIDLESAVINLVDACFNSYQATSAPKSDLNELRAAGEQEFKMISALSWLPILQKWDNLADSCKQLLDIWLPKFQVRAALDLNQEITLSKVLTVSHHDDPNSQLMVQLNAHFRILAFLGVLISDKHSGRAVLVRIGDVDQYLGVDQIDINVREFYVYYCYDQLLKFLDAREDAPTLKLELATHISSRPGILALLDRHKFLKTLIHGISKDIVRNPQHILSY